MPFAAIAEGGTDASGAGQRTIGRIPVRNLWLLMLYASDLVRVSGEAWIKLDGDPEELPDLVAELLCAIVERRLRRNLSTGYATRREILRRVRGRIDILQTARRRLLERGQVACRYEHLTIDTPRNRFVRFALGSVARVVSQSALRYQCHDLAADLALLGVASVKPTAAQISADRVARQDANDRLMVALAQLACDLALPTEEAGSEWLPAPSREIEWVRRLYEKAVAGFYGVALIRDGWQVRHGATFGWPVAAQTLGIADILPHMRIDIVLERADERRIIVDTKFNALLTQGWYREESLRSGYLYQIYAYLRSQGGNTMADRAEGLLLHPAVGGEIVDEAMKIQGHIIRFSTVDLAAPAANIRERLLNVINCPLTFQ